MFERAAGWRPSPAPLRRTSPAQGCWAQTRVLVVSIHTRSRMRWTTLTQLPLGFSASNSENSRGARRDGGVN